ncbi:MAG: hypothetical protein AAF485_05390 [Chloroflexota bacterium]
MQVRLRYPVVWGVVVMASMLFVTGCGVTTTSLSEDAQAVASVDQIQTATQSSQTAEEAAFDTVMTVMTSPRCSNCHPTGDRPRQRDEQIIHLFNVTRGEDNHGGPVQTCETCHHEENNPYSLVPGAPHWGLAPKSMGWFGLTDAEIAQTLLDPAKNGGRTHEELLHHVSEDPLVLWAWDPGEGRTPPPVSHEEFVEAMAIWLEAGAPIPEE